MTLASVPECSPRRPGWSLARSPALIDSEYVLRRSAIVAAITTAGAAILVALSLPVAEQVQNHALDKCAAHLDGGTVSVHWKSLVPPHYVCALNGRDVKRLPPIR